MTEEQPLPFDWGFAVPRLIHPMRVAIIEALDYMDQPLSASDLRDLFDGKFTVPMISYHLNVLRKIKVVVLVREEQKRGSFEKFYRLRVR